LTTPCLTDYISRDNLQTFLDESSQQDGIALRLWSPNQLEKEKSCWINDSWNNACQFHALIRTYPSGKEACYQYFSQKADEIIQNKDIEWDATRCPTSLYIFGWPIYDGKGQVLAILFGGLVRDPAKTIANTEWSNVKEKLEVDLAVIKELENEYCYAPDFSLKQRKHLFSKWKLFCELLSRHLAKNVTLKPHDDCWVDWLISFHSCSTIAGNLTKIKKIKKSFLQLTIVDESSSQSQPVYYPLLITDKVQLDKADLEEAPKQLIPVNKNNRISLSFDKSIIKNNGRNFYWKVSKNIISGILIDHGNKNVTHRRLLLERQAQVFKEVSKKAVTNLESMIDELFDQLRKIGIIDINFASFSEVIYFSDNDNDENSRPHFKARVTYPREQWTVEQCNVIEKLDLYTDEPIANGSTVFSFQKSRAVLDRDVKKSPTYVEVHPDVRSSLVIPINYGPLVLGVITFDSIEKNYFNCERKLQLENLTQLISPVVYHNKFQETLQSLNQNIQNSAKELTDASKKIIRKHILRALCSLVQAEAASYWEQDKKNGTTLYRGTSIGAVNGFQCEMIIQDSTLGDLFKGKKDFVLMPDIEEEYRKIKQEKSPDQHTLDSLKYLQSRGILSYLAFPVMISDKKVIISFYRFNNELLKHREFSSIELNITQRLGKILSFYESLNKIFDVQRKELELQLKSREELAITLAHNIKSPLSSTYARLDDLERTLKASIGETYHSENYASLFNAIKSNFFAIKRSTTPMLKHLALQESYNYGFYSVQAFHIYYDILSRQIARVRRGMQIENKLEKRIVEFSGHRKFPLLYGDKTAIEDMISNLLENAVKYSEKNSKISVETNYDYVSGEIQVYIKNEGEIYIPAEDIDRIFEYAYRAKIARDKDPSSTGVGLYYSRYIAKQHGATLTVARISNPVTFELVIPARLLNSVKKAEETLSSNNEM